MESAAKEEVEEKPMLNTKGLTLEISSGAGEPVIKVENSNFAASDKENKIQP